METGVAELCNIELLNNDDNDDETAADVLCNVELLGIDCGDDNEETTIVELCKI